MKIRIETYLLYILIITLFAQIWFQVGSFTIRLEDVIVFLLLIIVACNYIINKKQYLFSKKLKLALITFALLLIVSVVNTLMNNYPVEVKQNSIVNGTRLIFSILSLFVSYYLVSNKYIKIENLITVLVGFSAITTVIALLQILYWDSVLPFELPDLLTTLKEGANIEQGREIFALYVGDTGSHRWSAMLSVQFIVIFFITIAEKSYFKKIGLIIYLCIFTYILFRISVRNSILGIIISIMVSLIVISINGKFNFKNIFKGFGVFSISIILLISMINILPADNYLVQRFLSVIPDVSSDGLQVDRDSNIVGRIYYWYFAWVLFLSMPIIGTGLYSYGHLSELNSLMPTVHAHNSYFNYLAETGIIGFVALIILLIVIFHEIIRLWKYSIISKHFIILRNSILALFIFISFTALFGNTLYSPTELMIRFIILGAVLAFTYQLPHYAIRKH